MAEIYFDTLSPDAISPELEPAIDELELHENCRELVMQGWTVIHDVASAEFNDKFRQKIIELQKTERAHNMLLMKDPLFVEATLSPKLLAMAEFQLAVDF